MVPDAPSPFVEIPQTDWVCANALAFAVYDRFPVSPQSVLVPFNTDGSGAGGGRLTVNKPLSEQALSVNGSRHKRIQLLPEQSEFEPIALELEDSADLVIVGTSSQTVGPLTHR